MDINSQVQQFLGAYNLYVSSKNIYQSRVIRLLADINSAAGEEKTPSERLGREVKRLRGKGSRGSRGQERGNVWGLVVVVEEEEERGQTLSGGEAQTVESYFRPDWN